MISEIQFNTTKSPFQPDKKAFLNLALGPVLKDLDLVRESLTGLLPVESRIARLIADHVFSSGGKMIRPAMFLMCCQLTGYRGAHRIRIAAVCEYVHTASLLHDDVVDNSPVRRNKPTANSLWGDKAAVLAGDLIYSTASELMASTGKLALVSSFAGAIRSMSEGELLHLDELFSPDISREQYLRILSGKTAVLMGASCKSAGILADIRDDQIQALEDFGHDLGMAFQLTDDALDYSSEARLTGKKTLADLPEGKITLPVILLRDLVSPEEQKKIRDLLANKHISLEDVRFIAELTRKYRTTTQTLDLAASYTRKAITALEGHFAKTPERQHLTDLGQALLSRSF